jgi:hypothetical protein
MSSEQPPATSAPTSTFQEESTRRKFIYAGIILVLFTVALVWRKVDTTITVPGLGPVSVKGINAQGTKLAIREESRGDVELLGSVVRLSLLGSRGVVTCVLWHAAFERQKKNQWNEMELLVRALTRLQPHFISPWLFQSWNLAYNVSVEADRPREKYFYISRGLELLARGERQNRHHPDLRWHLGFYGMHKIGRSDDTNYQRSLMQLSLIPPNERDPARFWKEEDGKKVFNWVEFRKFCEEHPQLIRRLNQGMHKENQRAWRQLFRCKTPLEVVDFLEANYSVPGLYPSQPLVGAAQDRTWTRDTTTAVKFADELERFPVLPPGVNATERTGIRPFDANALTSDSNLGDNHDIFNVAHGWFSYAQEPLPAPAELPGQSQPITDRARQKGPKNLTWLIFRNYPAQARRYTAERLQEEGWFDTEAWDVTEELFKPFPGGTDMPFLGETITLKLQKPDASEEAWAEAYRAWKDHGEQNHLIIPQVDLANKTADATRFAKRYNMAFGGMPPKHLRRENMTPREQREFDAATYMFEYEFYNRVSNFKHHYTRCGVEMMPATVACKKMFFKAEEYELHASRPRALETYEKLITPEVAREDPTLAPLLRVNKKKDEPYYTPLTAWIDLVLKEKPDYRFDSFTQEHSAEVQVRYMLLFAAGPEQRLKEDMVKVAEMLPLVPKLDAGTFPGALQPGPFEALDKDGKPWVSDEAFEVVHERMNLPTRRRRQPVPPPPGGPPQPIRKDK